MNPTRPPGDAFRWSPFGATDVRALAHYWPVVVVLALAVTVRSLIWLNADVSWLLTLGEQVLAGARAYVDFSEPNPPASILIYMPAILLAQVAGTPAEAMLTVLVLAGGILSLWLAGCILPKNELTEPAEKPALFAIGCALLLILPGDNFAERENIALIAILPMVAVYAARASGTPVSAFLACLAGIGGGIVIAIKPYFILALALPLPYVAWRWSRNIKGLASAIFWPEHLMVAVVVLGYGVLLLWQYSDYLQHTLPLVLTLYVPLRYSLLLMIANISVILVAMATIVGLALGMREFRNPVIRVAALAVLGFTLALIVQGKGWPYHGYPAVALSLLVLSVLLLRRLSTLSRGPTQSKSVSIDLAFGGFLFVCIYALASYWFLQEPDRSALVSEVSRFVPANPKILSIEGSPGVAFPLTRKLHGAPLGRTPFQWISAYTDRLLTAGVLDPTGNRQILDPALRRTIEAYERMDRNELVDTIRTRRPDVILIGGKNEHHWALSHPDIASVLQPYRQVETFDGVEIWLPRKTSDPVSE